MLFGLGASRFSHAWVEAHAHMKKRVCACVFILLFCSYFSGGGGGGGCYFGAADRDNSYLHTGLMYGVMNATYSWSCFSTRGARQ